MKHHLLALTLGTLLTFTTSSTHGAEALHSPNHHAHTPKTVHTLSERIAQRASAIEDLKSRISELENSRDPEHSSGTKSLNILLETMEEMLSKMRIMQLVQNTTAI